jgi:hypothetical protein
MSAACRFLRTLPSIIIFHTDLAGANLNTSEVVVAYPVVTIRVRRSPKPAPVKRRLPTACRFYFAEFAVPRRLYLRHTPARHVHHQLAHGASLISTSSSSSNPSTSLIALAGRPPPTALTNFLHIPASNCILRSVQLSGLICTCSCRERT